MSVLANLAVTLGMLLIVPFGLALIDAPGWRSCGAGGLCPL